MQLLEIFLVYLMAKYSRYRGINPISLQTRNPDLQSLNTYVIKPSVHFSFTKYFGQQRHRHSTTNLETSPRVFCQSHLERGRPMGQVDRVALRNDGAVCAWQAPDFSTVEADAARVTVEGVKYT